MYESWLDLDLKWTVKDILETTEYKQDIRWCNGIIIIYYV